MGVDNNTDPKSDFDVKAYKHAISMIESSGGKNLWNNTSSATGMYQFLYESIKDDPDMDGVSRREFMNRPDLQEKIMDKALSGTLKGYTYGSGYAKKLKDTYNSDYSIGQLTALVHFVGAGNARKFLRDPNEFKISGVNISPQKYLELYNKHTDSYLKMNQNPIVPTSPTNTEVKDERIESQVAVDNTAVKTPIQKETPMFVTPRRQRMMDENIDLSMKGISAYQDRQEDLNNFEEGGHLDASKNVTLFENGGTHEQNPLGGIPQGIGANGKPNLVEEGETKWDDYIFSNAINLDGVFLEEDGKENTFNTGGKLDKKKAEKTEPEHGPQPETEYPLKFIKKEPQTTAYGGMRMVEEERLVHDIRDKYIAPNYISTNPGEVNFDQAVTDESGRKFAERYNDPWTREQLKKQTGLDDKAIDNMILQGLEAEKHMGGTSGNAKASYDAKGNIINVNPEHQHDSGALLHERVHASNIDAAQGSNLKEVLGNAFQQEGRNLMKKWDIDTVRYLNKDHEAYGNFTEFREKLGLKPGEQITPEELKKRVKEKGLGSENFYRVYNDENITKALNTIAMNDIDDEVGQYVLA